MPTPFSAEYAPTPWRRRYLHRLRFALRAYPHDFVEDAVQQIDDQIQDAVDDALLRRKRNPAELTRQQRGWADRRERRIVAKLIPPDQMAQRLSEIFRRKHLLDASTLAADLLPVMVGAAMILAPGDGRLDVASILWRGGGALAAATGFSSAILQRAPFGKLTAIVLRATRMTSFASLLGIATTGSMAVVATISVLHSVNTWSASVHLALPSTLLSWFAVFLLAIQRRELRHSERSARRYIDLTIFRDEHFFTDRRNRQKQEYLAARKFGYFTQEDP